MNKNLKKNLAAMPARLGASLKSLVKLAVQTRRSGISRRAADGERLIILGNGPSLAQTIERYGDTALRSNALMAVNFAANTPQFAALRPQYYILADPIFFGGDTNEKVMQLWQNLSDTVDWPMTIFVPMQQTGRVRLHNRNITVEGFNFVGIEGFGWLTRAAFDAGRGMPRPRNVLIPAIMTGIRLGYKEIYITGADHSWTKTLDVDDDNRVVTVQPHFYKDDEAERQRVTQVYRDIHMHDILLSFHIAFKAYFAIADYARRRHIDIYNATPGSFIDAFPRLQLPE